jgi:hypothetical protein
MIPSLEQSVRPFEHLPLYVQQLIESRPVKPDDAQAYLRWGRKGKFAEADLQESFSIGLSPGSKVTSDPEKDTPLKNQPKTHNFEEVNRKTSSIRVENPKNAKHFVMVERIDEITFKGPRQVRAVVGHGRGARAEQPFDEL